MPSKKNRHKQHSPEKCKTAQRHDESGEQDDAGIIDAMGQARDLLYGQQNVHLNHQNFPDKIQNIQHTTLSSEQGQGQGYVLQQGNYNGQQYPYFTHPQSMHCSTNQNGMQSSTLPTQDNSIPLWAANLCNQVMNMQKSIDSHLHRWQAVETHIASQNQKMGKIEQQINELSKLKANYEKTNSQVNQTRREIKALGMKVAEYDNTIQQYSDICDDMTGNNSDFDKGLHKIEQQMESIEGKQKNIESKLANTDDRITDLQWRSMRENLLFCGIPESKTFREEGENCERVVKTFLREQLGIERDIPLDRAHRLGRYRRDHVRPRPIVAKFTYFKDKEYVKSQGHEKLPDTDYWVKDQYPREIENKRRDLYEVADEYRKNPENKVKFVRDRLYINGTQYTAGGNNPSNNKRNDDQDFHRNRMRGPSRFTQDKENQSNNSQWGRTFYRRKNGPNMLQQNDRVAYTNRFAELAKDNAQATPRHTGLGKKKATSPLENDSTFKKQHVDSSDSDSESSDTAMDLNEQKQQESSEAVQSEGPEAASVDDQTSTLLADVQQQATGQA